MKIGLDGDKPEHQALYWQMKVCASSSYASYVPKTYPFSFPQGGTSLD